MSCILKTTLNMMLINVAKHVEILLQRYEFICHQNKLCEFQVTFEE